MQVEGDYLDESLIKIASDRFQLLLGSLRAWNPVAEERRDELRPGVSSAIVRDERGNQSIQTATAISYKYTASGIADYAGQVKAAIDHSSKLQDAIWIFGRRDRNAANCYVVYEYAENELGGNKGIRSELGISVKKLEKFTNSANNLSAIEGGRHADKPTIAKMDVREQIEFTATLLKKWIEYRAQAPA